MIEEQKEEEKRAGARNELWQDLWNERSLVGSLLCTLFENLKFCSNSININSNFFKFRGKLNELRINLTNDWLLNRIEIVQISPYTGASVKKPKTWCYIGAFKLNDSNGIAGKYLVFRISICIWR